MVACLLRLRGGDDSFSDNLKDKKNNNQDSNWKPSKIVLDNPLLHQLRHNDDASSHEDISSDDETGIKRKFEDDESSLTKSKNGKPLPKRCKVENCCKAARGATDKCIAHGGGKRCKIDACTKSAVGATSFCVKHGGGRRCGIADCPKSARGGSLYCAKHGTIKARERQACEGITKSSVPQTLASILSAANNNVIPTSMFNTTALQQPATFSSLSALSQLHPMPMMNSWSNPSTNTMFTMPKSLEMLLQQNLLYPQSLVNPGWASTTKFPSTLTTTNSE